MTPEHRASRRSARAILAALALILALPATASGGGGGYQTSADSMMVPLGGSGATFVPLVNSGENALGTLFEGLPDGIGIVPEATKKNVAPTYVDLYVNHEQSHVPFGLSATSVFADGTGIGDPHDSSVTRLRLDVATQTITETEVVLPGGAGFIRFCSSFVVSGKGFEHPILLTNEESNDVLPVPAGATYGADPSVSPNRQAGYTVYLDTVTGEYGPIPGMGRHNHENQVLIPGWKNELPFLSGDDTFTAPSSQLYMYLADDAEALLSDHGKLYAFQVNRVDGAKVDPSDPFNNANDYLDISAGETFSGKFIRVPSDIARGTTADLPQTALENWSNANNVFQFIRVEDIAYDPDNPRVVYFADTGSTVSPSATGRMQAGGTGQRGRIFKMILNSQDPKVVDSLTILADGNNAASNFNRPDNIEVGHDSIMIQEDATNSRVWMYTLSAATPAWTAVARVDSVPTSSATDPGESSGIIDMSAWLGAGWWALDVQAHQDADQSLPTAVHFDQLVDPTFHVWAGGPVPPGPVIPPGGASYRYHREKGQLLLMHVPGS